MKVIFENIEIDNRFVSKKRIGKQSEVYDSKIPSDDRLVDYSTNRSVTIFPPIPIANIYIFIVDQIKSNETNKNQFN